MDVTLGDFNLHIDELLIDGLLAADLIIITEYFNFQQHVSGPAHIIIPTFHDTFLSSFDFQSIQVQEQLWNKILSNGNMFVLG